MSDKARKIALIAAILAIMGFLYATSISGGGGVSFNGNQADLNGSQLNNGTFNGTFNKSVNKLIFKYDFVGQQEWVNITNISINNDSYYDIYAIMNSSTTAPPIALKIFFNGDFNEANYRRQYIYADGVTVIAGGDFTTDISAVNTGMSSSSKIHIEKSHSRKTRLIIEGNLDEGISFFNMQMYHLTPDTDIKNISFRLVPPGIAGVKVHVFALR